MNFIEKTENGCNFINETSGTAASLIDLIVFDTIIFLILTNFNKLKFD